MEPTDKPTAPISTVCISSLLRFYIDVDVDGDDDVDGDGDVDGDDGDGTMMMRSLQMMVW